MKIEEIRIQNYKSLKDVTFRPGGLCVLVGPNASGKSNFVDALDFLAKTYRHGLARAVQMKGGFESIVFRRKRRSKAPVCFNVTANVSDEDSRHIDWMWNLNTSKTKVEKLFSIHHYFSLLSSNKELSPGYEIRDENFQILSPSSSHLSLKYLRNRDKDTSCLLKNNSLVDETTYLILSKTAEYIESQQENTQLFFSGESNNTLLRNVAEMLAKISIACFSPQICKQPGFPIANPELSPTGENLSIVIDWLISNFPDEWDNVLHAMQDIYPSLQDIKTAFLHNNSITLKFHEQGVGKAWYANQISDGTIQALAILVSIADPRNIMSIIEEPENSVHPWVLRTMLDRFRELSRNKHIILTTHSPVLIDHLYPSEILIASRENGETRITPLLELDPDVQQHWENGDYNLSDLLDSGLLPQAIPGGVL